MDLLAPIGRLRDKTGMSTFRYGHLGALLLAGSIALGPVAARAHAIVVSSVPAAGAVVHDKSGRVVVRFNSRIDRVRSRLLLVRADGTATTLELSDTPGPDTLAATIGELEPGSYRLRWQVLAIDGHITRGDIPFTVAP
jgi:methionine-rich copper-binding protein CopC